MSSVANLRPDSAPLEPVAVAEGYARWAPFYDQTPNPLLAREERYLLSMLPDLQHKSVLDAACGTGRWLEKLLARGSGSSAGIDNSPAMLRVASSKNSASGRLARADCEYLPFRSGAFDFVICSFAVGHISNLSGMAREFARITRLDADVFVSDLHPEAYARGWRVGFREGDAAIQIRSQDRSAGEIVETFCSHGFRCELNVTLSLGQPEESVFAKAGKAHLFLEASRMPAVIVCRFRRLGSRVDV